MVTRIEFTNRQKIIIQDICRTQLASLKRIQEDETDEDVEFILIQHGTDIMAFEKELSSTIENFEEVFNYPERLTLLDDDQISVFRHILAHIEDQLLPEFPKSVKNLWKKLFDIEDFNLNKTSPGQLN